MFEYYIYQHYIPNSQTPFYIGKGKGRNFFRAKSKRNRNNYWHNVVNKNGYEIKITHKEICSEEACSIEKYLISFYGRRDLKNGVLCNMTDGGEGSVNYKHTKESKEKIGNFFLGKYIGDKNPQFGKKISEEHKKNISEAAKISNKKRVYTDETKRKISESVKNFYKNNPDKVSFLRSPEKSKKLSEKLKGRVFTDEWKDKISKSKKK